jgi:hypothetical protein
VSQNVHRQVSDPLPISRGNGGTTTSGPVLALLPSRPDSEEVAPPTTGCGEPLVGGAPSERSSPVAGKLLVQRVAVVGDSLGLSGTDPIVGLFLVLGSSTAVRSVDLFVVGEVWSVTGHPTRPAASGRPTSSGGSAEQQQR